MHMKDLRIHGTPIVVDPALAIPFEGLPPLLDGFRTVHDIVEGCRHASRNEMIRFLASGLREGKIVWKEQWSPLRWCLRCNIPLLQDRCDLCGASSAGNIDMKFPCNPRPVLPHDEAMFRSVGLPWPVDASVVVNAYDRPDHAGWEIFSQGAHRGDIVCFVDGQRRYRFQPSTPLDPDPFKWARGSSRTMADLIAANSSRLDRMEQEAVDFLRKQLDQYRFSIPVVAFSGGKDSLVLLHLCSQTGLRMRLVQIDTGIDPVSNRGFSERLLADYPSFRVKRIENGDLFWRAMTKLGPPARDFQWCRIILKNGAPYREKPSRLAGPLELLKLFVKPTVILIDGPRRREEPRRVALNRKEKVPTQRLDVVTIRPILDFTDLDVWMYIHGRHLPVHPTYAEEKSQRLICLYCPDKSRQELSCLREDRPEQWRRFEEELSRWRKILRFPEQWISEDLWIRDEPVSGRMRALGIESRVGALAARLESVLEWGDFEPEGDRYVMKGKINLKADLSGLRRWLKPLGRSRVRRRKGKLHFESKGFSVEISREGALHVTHGESKQAAAFRDTLRNWMISYLNCIGCGACSSYCRRIRIRNRRAIVGSRCNGCMDCVENVIRGCPVNPVGVFQFRAASPKG